MCSECFTTAELGFTAWLIGTINPPLPPISKSRLEVDSQELRCDCFSWLFMPPWVFICSPFFPDFKCSELVQRSVASRAFMRPELWGMRLVTGEEEEKKKKNARGNVHLRAGETAWLQVIPGPRLNDCRAVLTHLFPFRWLITTWGANLICIISLLENSTGRQVATRKNGKNNISN